VLNVKTRPASPEHFQVSTWCVLTWKKSLQRGNLFTLCTLRVLQRERGGCARVSPAGTLVTLVADVFVRAQFR
jgi:hypothetical protein